MEDSLKVVKIGGKLLDDASRLEEFLSAFVRLKGNKILVHGGGSLATKLSRQLGIEPRMVNGRRITTAKDMEMAAMVYAGLINKKLVAALQAQGCHALGLSGADANVILADKRPVEETDFGWVGDIKKVNDTTLQFFLQQGLTPVLCAVTHDGKGNLLNTNADTIAAETAAAMSKRYRTTLLYCFEKPGVLQQAEENGPVIPILDYALYEKGKEEGWIHHGMLPKLHTGFEALRRNVAEVKIGNEQLPDENCTVFTMLKL